MEQNADKTAFSLRS